MTATVRKPRVFLCHRCGRTLHRGEYVRSRKTGRRYCANLTTCGLAAK